MLRRISPMSALCSWLVSASPEMRWPRTYDWWKSHLWLYFDNQVNLTANLQTSKIKIRSEQSFMHQPNNETDAVVWLKSCLSKKKKKYFKFPNVACAWSFQVVSLVSIWSLVLWQETCWAKEKQMSQQSRGVAEGTDVLLEGGQWDKRHIDAFVFFLVMVEQGQ